MPGQRVWLTVEQAAKIAAALEVLHTLTNTIPDDLTPQRGTNVQGVRYTGATISGLGMYPGEVVQWTGKEWYVSGACWLRGRGIVAGVQVGMQIGNDPDQTDGQPVFYATSAPTLIHTTPGSDGLIHAAGADIVILDDYGSGTIPIVGITEDDGPERHVWIYTKRPRSTYDGVNEGENPYITGSITHASIHWNSVGGVIKLKQWFTLHAVGHGNTWEILDLIQRPGPATLQQGDPVGYPYGLTKDVPLTRVVDDEDDPDFGVTINFLNTLRVKTGYVTFLDGGDGSTMPPNSLFWHAGGGIAEWLGFLGPGGVLPDDLHRIPWYEDVTGLVDGAAADLQSQIDAINAALDGGAV